MFVCMYVCVCMHVCVCYGEIGDHLQRTISTVFYSILHEPRVWLSWDQYSLCLKQQQGGLYTWFFEAYDRKHWEAGRRLSAKLDREHSLLCRSD